MTTKKEKREHRIMSGIFGAILIFASVSIIQLSLALSSREFLEQIVLIFNICLTLFSSLIGLILLTVGAGCFVAGIVFVGCFITGLEL